MNGESMLRVAWCGAILLFAATAGAVTATVPANVNVQGVLRDGVGGLESGTFQFTLRVYAVAVGGTALWTETQSSVPVESGFFTLTLSSNDGGTMTIAEVIETNASPLFVGVTLQGDASELPRIPLNTVPYAFVADHATTVDTFGGIDTTHIGNLFGSNGTANKCAGASFATGIDTTGNVTCATPAGTTYTAPASGGIVLGTGPPATIALTSACSNGQVLVWNGSAWACGAGGASYTATSGGGLTFAGTAAAPTVGITACSSGQVQEWNGSAWSCQSPVAVNANGTLTLTPGTPPTLSGNYTANNGITLSASSPPTFSLTAQSCTNAGTYASGINASGALTCSAPVPAGIASFSCPFGFVSSFGATGVPSCTSPAAYTNGAGIDLSSNTFSAAVDATSIKTASVAAGSALQLVTQTCAANKFMTSFGNSGTPSCTAPVTALDAAVTLSASNQIGVGIDAKTITKSGTGGTLAVNPGKGITIAGSNVAASVDTTTVAFNASNQLTAAPVLATIATNTCAGGTFVTHMAADGTLTCAGAGASTTTGDVNTIAVSGGGVASLATNIKNPVWVTGGTGSLTVGASATAAPANDVDFSKATGMKAPVITNVTVANAITVYAACAANSTVIGGGCSNIGSKSVFTSCPASASGTCVVALAAPSQAAAGGWSCTFSGAAASNTAYSICLQGF